MKTLESQSIIDIAIQQSGTAEAAYEIAAQNGLSITDEPMPGIGLSVPAVAINKPVATYYSNKGIKPATASTDEMDDVSDLERVFFPELPVEFS